MDRLNEVFSIGFAGGSLSILRRLAAWPAKVVAARRAIRQLAGMSDHELRDIGLSRQDLRDATALPPGADPPQMFAARAQERKRSQNRAAGLGGARGAGQPKTSGPRLSHRQPVAAE
jgi:uncharacterized protein YjiS (DUF1127 family)